MPTESGTYQALAERILTGDRDGLRARWEFGRALLAERAANGGNQLPDGRLDGLARTYDLDRRELQRWVQFAEEFDTEEKYDTACRTYGSWHAIANRVRGPRGSAVRRGAGEAETLPVRGSVLRWLREVTRAAHAAGLARNADDLGHGLEAVRQFLEGVAREAWKEHLESRHALLEAA